MAEKARPRRARGKKGAARRQLNVRVEPRLYRALAAVARDERRSVPQAAIRLLEEGLRRGVSRAVVGDDAPGREIARLALAGGAFDWLGEEPDLYDETSGEPV